MSGMIVHWKWRGVWYGLFTSARFGRRWFWVLAYWSDVAEARYK
jgi:hypothetical protein